METSQSEIQPPHRAGHLWLLVLVCLGAFWLRSEGINWPKFHPDEQVIKGWVERTADHGYITDKVYAGGFFTLARPVQWICRAVHGAAHAFAYHQGATDRPDNDPFDAILFARWFNVWLGTLTCLFMYGLVRRITKSGGAGVLAAALLAFAQYPVEHCHYAETDIAMVFMLTMTFWLWAIAIGNRHLFAFSAAALASGFTAGTKFPLLLLVLIVLVMGLARTGRPISWRGFVSHNAGLARGLGYAGLGVGLFALGFILANPRTIMDWSGFQAGLAWESRRGYGETALNMGLLKNDPHARYCLHFLELLRSLTTLGWGWIVLTLVGIPCACLKEYRRFWPVLLLFPALYTVYWIFTAPWVRTQEFMNYLPALAGLATLPLTIMWRTRRLLFRVTAALIACAALMLNAGNGLRVAALFDWTDTRLLARQWLERHLPDTAKPAVESYAGPACPDTHNPPVLIIKMEHNDLASLKDQGVDFLLRAASITGRGLTHPVTGRRYPETQRLFDEFRVHSERLGSWGPLTRRNLATFLSPTIELWGLNRFTPRYHLSLELSQPLFVNNVYPAGTLRPAFFSSGHKLGSATGLLVDSRKRVLAIGGPRGRKDPVYLMLNTDERNAAVHIRGFGRHHTVTLAPYSVAIVPLNRFYWPGRGMPFERITLAAVPQEDVIYLPCYARVAYSPAEVARICTDLGQDEAFWNIFTADDLAQGADPIQRYILAVRAARWDLADRWEEEAARTGAALAASILANPADVEINGNSGYYYDALARVRLHEFGLSRAGYGDSSWESLLKTATRDLMRLELSADNQPEGTVLERTMTLPVRTARGIYALSGELFVQPDPSRKHLPTVVEYTLNQRDTWTGCYPTNTSAGWMSFTARFSVNTEIQPAITVRSPAPAQLYFKNLELRWSLASALESTRRSLVTARAAHALHRGRRAEARDLLNKLDASKEQPDALEIRQLKFKALLDSEDHATSRLADAARDVLALAPDTYACLSVLAAGNPAIKVKVNELTATLKQPIACGPFLSLVGFSFDPGRRELAGVFEVLKNETPPLAALLCIRRHGEWRPRQSEPLSSRPRLHRGERVGVRIKLNEKFGTACDIRQIGLGIETAVTWHPGRIPITGRRDAVIRLSEIGP